MASGVTCLVASWIYILLLRAKVRDCMAYIGERIVKCKPGFDFADGSPREERETKAIGNRPRARSSAAAPAQPEEERLADKPHLIVESAGDRPLVGLQVLALPAQISPHRTPATEMGNGRTIPPLPSTRRTGTLTRSVGSACTNRTP